MAYLSFLKWKKKYVISWKYIYFDDKEKQNGFKVLNQWCYIVTIHIDKNPITGCNIHVSHDAIMVTILIHTGKEMNM
jgi:hypothetical protein